MFKKMSSSNQSNNRTVLNGTIQTRGKAFGMTKILDADFTQTPDEATNKYLCLAPSAMVFTLAEISDGNIGEFYDCLIVNRGAVVTVNDHLGNLIGTIGTNASGWLLAESGPNVWNLVPFQNDAVVVAAPFKITGTNSNLNIPGESYTFSLSTTSPDPVTWLISPNGVTFPTAPVTTTSSAMITYIPTTANGSILVCANAGGYEDKFEYPIVPNQVSHEYTSSGVLNLIDPEGDLTEVYPPPRFSSSLPTTNPTNTVTVTSTNVQAPSLTWSTLSTIGGVTVTSLTPSGNNVDVEYTYGSPGIIRLEAVDNNNIPYPYEIKVPSGIDDQGDGSYIYVNDDGSISRIYPDFNIEVVPVVTGESFELSASNVFNGPVVWSFDPVLPGLISPPDSTSAIPVTFNPVTQDTKLVITGQDQSNRTKTSTVLLKGPVLNIVADESINFQYGTTGNIAVQTVGEQGTVTWTTYQNGDVNVIGVTPTTPNNYQVNIQTPATFATGDGHITLVADDGVNVIQKGIQVNLTERITQSLDLTSVVDNSGRTALIYQRPSFDVQDVIAPINTSQVNRLTIAAGYASVPIVWTAASTSPNITINSTPAVGINGVDVNFNIGSAEELARVTLTGLSVDPITSANRTYVEHFTVDSRPLASITVGSGIYNVQPQTSAGFELSVPLSIINEPRQNLNRGTSGSVVFEATGATRLPISWSSSTTGDLNITSDVESGTDDRIYTIGYDFLTGTSPINYIQATVTDTNGVEKTATVWIYPSLTGTGSFGATVDPFVPVYGSIGSPITVTAIDATAPINWTIVGLTGDVTATVSGTGLTPTLTYDTPPSFVLGDGQILLRGIDSLGSELYKTIGVPLIGDAVQNLNGSVTTKSTTGTPIIISQRPNFIWPLQTPAPSTTNNVTVTATETSSNLTWSVISSSPDITPGAIVPSPTSAVFPYTTSANEGEFELVIQALDAVGNRWQERIIIDTRQNLNAPAAEPFCLRAPNTLYATKNGTGTITITADGAVAPFTWDAVRIQGDTQVGFAPGQTSNTFVANWSTTVDGEVNGYIEIKAVNDATQHEEKHIIDTILSERNTRNPDGTITVIGSNGDPETIGTIITDNPDATATVDNGTTSVELIKEPTATGTYMLCNDGAQTTHFKVGSEYIEVRYKGYNLEPIKSKNIRDQLTGLEYNITTINGNPVTSNDIVTDGNSNLIIREGHYLDFITKDDPLQNMVYTYAFEASNGCETVSGNVVFEYKNDLSLCNSRPIALKIAGQDLSEVTIGPSGLQLTNLHTFPNVNNALAYNSGGCYFTMVENSTSTTPTLVRINREDYSTEVLATTAQLLVGDTNKTTSELTYLTGDAHSTEHWLFLSGVGTTISEKHMIFLYPEFNTDTYAGTQNNPNNKAIPVRGPGGTTVPLSNYIGADVVFNENTGTWWTYNNTLNQQPGFGWFSELKFDWSTYDGTVDTSTGTSPSIPGSYVTLTVERNFLQTTGPFVPFNSGALFSGQDENIYMFTINSTFTTRAQVIINLTPGATQTLGGATGQIYQGAFISTNSIDQNGDAAASTNGPLVFESASLPSNFTNYPGTPTNFVSTISDYPLGGIQSIRLSLVTSPDISLNITPSAGVTVNESIDGFSTIYDLVSDTAQPASFWNTQMSNVLFESDQDVHDIYIVNVEITNENTLTSTPVSNCVNVFGTEICQEDRFNTTVNADGNRVTFNDGTKTVTINSGSDVSQVTPGIINVTPADGLPFIQGNTINFTGQPTAVARGVANSVTVTPVGPFTGSLTWTVSGEGDVIINSDSAGPSDSRVINYTIQAGSNTDNYIRISVIDGASITSGVDIVTPLAVNSGALDTATVTGPATEAGVLNRQYFVDVAAGPVTINLPTGSNGDIVSVKNITASEISGEDIIINANAGQTIENARLGGLGTASNFKDCYPNENYKWMLVDNTWRLVSSLSDEVNFITEPASETITAGQVVSLKEDCTVSVGFGEPSLTCFNTINSIERLDNNMSVISKRTVAGAVTLQAVIHVTDDVQPTLGPEVTPTNARTNLFKVTRLTDNSFMFLTIDDSSLPLPPTNEITAHLGLYQVTTGTGIITFQDEFSFNIPLNSDSGVGIDATALNGGTEYVVFHTSILSGESGQVQARHFSVTTTTITSNTASSQHAAIQTDINNPYSTLNVIDIDTNRIAVLASRSGVSNLSIAEWNSGTNTFTTPVDANKKTLAPSLHNGVSSFGTGLFALSTVNFTYSTYSAAGVIITDQTIDEVITTDTSAVNGASILFNGSNNAIYIGLNGNQELTAYHGKIALTAPYLVTWGLANVLSETTDVDEATYVGPDLLMIRGDYQFQQLSVNPIEAVGIYNVDQTNDLITNNEYYGRAPIGIAMNSGVVNDDIVVTIDYRYPTTGLLKGRKYFAHGDGTLTTSSTRDLSVLGCYEPERVGIAVSDSKLLFR